MNRPYEINNEGSNVQKAGFRAAFVCLPFAKFNYITQNSLRKNGRFSSIRLPISLRFSRFFPQNGGRF
jgi:hypothetical protein